MSKNHGENMVSNEVIESSRTYLQPSSTQLFIFIFKLNFGFCEVVITNHFWVKQVLPIRLTFPWVLQNAETEPLSLPDIL